MKKIQINIILGLSLCLWLNTKAQVPILNSFSSAKATIYLDFDGAEVEGTIWNETGNISAVSSGLSPASIIWIHKMVAQYFVLFNLNITTDEQVYKQAPARQRARIIITPDGSWYGPVTGVSVVGSFVSGDDIPAWVFMNALSNNPSFISAAIAHEIGHTLGLQHQSEYNSDGNMISELSGGETRLNPLLAPMMGIPFYKQAAWITGHSSLGVLYIQNDTASIAGAPNYIGYRKSLPETSSVENAVKVERLVQGSLELNSSGNFTYRIFDISGRLLTGGILKTGFNQIPTNPASTGIFVLQWSGESVSGSQKIML
jgi:hypothetical protein